MTGRIATYAVAGLTLIAVPAALASPGSASFTVSATLLPGNVTSPSGYCRQTTSASLGNAILTVVCSSGSVVSIEASPAGQAPWVPVFGAALRFTRLFEGINSSGQAPRAGDGLIEINDSYTALGTVTSWRHISRADNDYMEVQVGW